MKREDFLNHIRQSYLQASLPDVQVELPPDRSLSLFSPQKLQDAFIQEATLLNARVYPAGSEDQAYEAIGSIFDLHGAKSYLRWANVPLTRLEERLAEWEFVPVDDHVPLSADARKVRLLELAEVPIGITGALGGLADNGGLVTQHGMGNGRLASLVVPVHIAVLRVKDLFPSMAHFLHAHPQAVRDASNLVLTCGPSRTADIEQTLTIGVHGPKELHIILLT